jgi:serine kinase of HPr protein (carbohydrate metabolism regulator)
VTLKELAYRFDLEVLAAKNKIDREVQGGYASDLLSWVMAHAREGDVWLTIQSHPNIVAVAILVGLAGIVIAEGVEVDEKTIKKAEEEEIPILISKDPIYKLAGKFYEAGIKGIDP